MNDQPFTIGVATAFVDPTNLMDDLQGRIAALRADDVLAMLTDPRAAQIEGPAIANPHEIPDGESARLLRDTFLFSNGEARRAKRGLFARLFARGAIRGARVRIRASADTISTELPRNQTFDFVECMASRVPAEMIATLLGIDHLSKCDRFRSAALAVWKQYSDIARRCRIRPIRRLKDPSHKAPTRFWTDSQFTRSRTSATARAAVWLEQFFSQSTEPKGIP